MTAVLGTWLVVRFTSYTVCCTQSGFNTDVAHKQRARVYMLTKITVVNVKTAIHGGPTLTIPTPLGRLVNFIKAVCIYSSFKNVLIAARFVPTANFRNWGSRYESISTPKHNYLHALYIR